MKNYILIAMVALLGLASCKKTTNNYYGDEKKDPSTVNTVAPSTGENYKVSADFITAHDWKIVEIGRNPGNNGKAGMWKLQESKGSNNFLVIDPVEDEFYWSNDYKKGRVIWGYEVSKMKIKKF